jgi:hypothetical protein
MSTFRVKTRAERSVDEPNYINVFADVFIDGEYQSGGGGLVAPGVPVEWPLADSPNPGEWRLTLGISFTGSKVALVSTTYLNDVAVKVDELECAI